MNWLKHALAILGFIGYPFLIQAVAAGKIHDPLRTVIALGPIVLIGVWLAARSKHKLWWLAAGVVGTAAAAAFFKFKQLDLTLAYGVPHAAAYTLLLGVFARSLLPSREPVITRFARQIHGGLPVELVAYTRHVTAAWSLFFAVMLIGSVLLYAFAPLSAWLLFINVLNLPLLIAMFVGEYLFRIVRYPDFSHSSIFKGAQLISRLNASAPESVENR